uniref:Hydrophobin n=1 Tax=Peronospora matthiolae TaxID=2874970 RepID=A0AAV1TNS3_9STRA
MGAGGNNFSCLTTSLACGNLCSTASSSRGSHCSSASSIRGRNYLSTSDLSLKSEDTSSLVRSGTEQAVQRGPSLTPCTAGVVDVRSTTVTFGQSLGDTKGWVNTSLVSNLLRRLTDLAN